MQTLYLDKIMKKISCSSLHQNIELCENLRNTMESVHYFGNAIFSGKNRTKRHMRDSIIIFPSNHMKLQYWVTYIASNNHPSTNINFETVPTWVWSHVKLTHNEINRIWRITAVHAISVFLRIQRVSVIYCATLFYSSHIEKNECERFSEGFLFDLTDLKAIWHFIK